jgi:hypothetical protein
LLTSKPSTSDRTQSRLWIILPSTTTTSIAICRHGRWDTTSSTITDSRESRTDQPPAHEQSPKCCSLKQTTSSASQNPTKVVEVCFKRLILGNEIGDNFTPRLVQVSSQILVLKQQKCWNTTGNDSFQSNDDGLQNGVAVLFGHEIHLVDQDKMRASGLFLQSLQHTKSDQVLFRDSDSISKT